MRKNFFRFAIIIMAVMVLPCMVACSSSDDDTTKNGNTGYSEYVEPCFEWGATIDQVKAYMSSNSWNLVTDQGFLMYTDAKQTCAVYYLFSGANDGLYYCTVEYVGYSDSKLKGTIAETEKRYKTTLTKQQEAIDGNTYTQYAGYATINGKKIGIAITSDFATQITVIFAIPD